MANTIQNIDFSNATSEIKNNQVDIDFELQQSGGETQDKPYAALSNAAAWDPEYVSSQAPTLSNSNLTATGTSTPYANIRSTYPLKGRVQWEISLVDLGSAASAFGLINSEQDISGITWLGAEGDSVGLWPRDGNTNPDAVFIGGVEVKTTSGIDADIQVETTYALRYDDSTGLFEYKVGDSPWVHIATLDTSKIWFPAVSLRDTDAVAVANFGQQQNTVAITPGYSWGVTATDYYRELVVADGAIRLYEMNDTTMIDSISGANGTSIGSPTFQSSKIMIEGLTSFQTTATTDYINIPTTGLPIGAEPRTVELWVNRPNTGFGTDNVASLFAYGDEAVSRSFAIHLTPTGVRASFYGNSFETAFDYNNKTTHIALTYDGATARLYINGAHVGSKITALDTLATNAYIGRYTAGSDGYGITGNLDNLAIYDRDLSPLEVDEHFNMGKELRQPSTILSAYQTEVIADTPYLYYEFEDVVPTVQDLSGNNFHGNITGSLTTDFDGVSNSALKSTSNSSSNHIIPSSGNYDTIKCVEFWFKDVQASSGDAAIVGKSFSNSDRWVIMSRGSAVNKNFPSLFSGSANDSVISADVDYRGDPQWRHCVVQYRDSDSSTRMYVDGKIQSESFNGNIFSTASGASLMINGYMDNSQPHINGSIIGSIDSLALYNDELSEDRITTHYLLGRLGYVPNDRYQENTLSHNPLAYYRFNDVPGSTQCTDISGNNRHGTYDREKFAYYTLLRGGEYFNGYNTDDGPGNIQIPVPPFTDNSTLTVEAWVRIEKAYSDSTGSGIIWIGDETDTKMAGIYLTYHAGSPVVIAVGWGWLLNDLMYPYNWQNELLHIVVVYNSSGKSLYINGDLKISDSIPIVVGNSHGYIGGLPSQTKTYTEGMIDEVAIYDKELTSDEILYRYSIGLDLYNDNISLDIRTIQGAPTLSVNDSRIESSAPAGYNTAYSEVGLYTGKRYWETSISASGDPNSQIGLGITKNISNAYLGSEADSWGMWMRPASTPRTDIYTGGVSTGSLPVTINRGDIVGHLLDLENGEYSITINGGSAIKVSDISTSGPWFFGISIYEPGSILDVRFEAPFNFPIPEGYTGVSKDYPGYDHTLFVQRTDGVASTYVDWKKPEISLGIPATASGFLGTNVLSKNITLDTEFDLIFRRQSIGVWYDDDISDSRFSIQIFFDKNQGDITYHVSEWGYHLPVTTATEYINFEFRKSISLQSRVDWNGGVVTLNQSSPYETNDFNGTNTLTLRFVKNASTNKYSVAVFSNGALRESATIDHIFPNSTNAVINLHHNNYSRFSIELISDFTVLTRPAPVFTPYQSTIMQSGPKAYWPLNDTNSSFIEDVSGNFNHGYAESTVTALSNGVVDTSMLFTDQGRIRVDNSILGPTNNTEYAAEFWIKINSYPSTYLSPIGARASNNDSNFGVSILDNGLVRMDKFPPSNGIMVSNTSLTLGQWHHIVLQESSGIRYIYIDGSLDVSGAVEIFSGSPMTQWYIGSNGLLPNNVDVLIDEVAIYDRALTSQEIDNRITTAGGNPKTFEDHMLFHNAIGYWKFDESGVTTQADDSSGNLRHGTIVGSNITKGHISNHSTSFELPGTVGEFIDMSANAALDNTALRSGAYTYGIWFKRTNPAVSDYSHIVGAAGSFSIFLHSGELTLFNWDTVVAHKLSGVTLDDGNWHFLASTVDLDVGTQTIYIDSVNSGTYSAGVAAGNHSGFAVGAGVTTGVNRGIQPGKGYVDEAFLIPGILSEAEILNLYTSRSNEMTYQYALLDLNPIAYWKLDEVAGTTAIDSSSNAASDGTYFGNTTYGNGPLMGEGSSAYFDGSDDGISIPYNPILASPTQFGISAVINVSAPGTIFSWGDAGVGGQQGFSLRLFNFSEIGIDYFAGTWSDLRFNTYAFDPGSTYHIFLTGNITSGSDIHIYINGVLHDTKTMPTTLPSTSGFRYIGTNLNTTSYGDSTITGYIDEVALFNREVSALEISNLYSYAPTPAGPVEYAFTLPYNLDRITVTNYDFTLQYTLGLVQQAQYDFTLQYLLERTGTLAEHTFTLSYQSELGAQQQFESPLTINMITSLTGISASSFDLRYLSDFISPVEYRFSSKYRIKLDDTEFNFNFPYVLNKETRSVSSTFRLSYSLPLIDTTEHTFKSRYKLYIADAKKRAKSFVLKYKVSKSRQTFSNFQTSYKLEYSNIFERNFNFPYSARLIPVEIQTSSNFLDNGDGTYNYVTDIDMSNQRVGNYNIVVDNGSRYLKYLVNTNCGQHIAEGPITVNYNYTIDIPSFTPASSDIEYLPQDIKYYDGRFGWSNAEISSDWAEGTLIAATAFTSLLGPKPYATTDHTHVILVTSGNEGYYVFDYEVDAYTPILYLLDNSNNRIIHVSKEHSAEGSKFRHRLIAFLMPGDYTLIARTLVEGDQIPGPDAPYSIHGFGRQYGNTEIADRLISHGYQLDNEVPEDGVTFEINSINIEIENIDMDSSLSFSILDRDFSPVGVKWSSLIPKAEAGIESYSDVATLSSRVLRLKMKLPDECCFGRKLSLDEFETFCRIPTPKTEEKITYSASSKVNTSKTFGFQYEINLVEQNLESIEPTVLYIVDEADFSIRRSLDLGNTWEIIGSTLTAFEHTGSGGEEYIESGDEVAVEGAGGYVIMTTRIEEGP